MSTKLDAIKLILWTKTENSDCIIRLFFRLLKEKVEELLTGYIQGAIQASLKQIFGEIGGLTVIDVLNLDTESGKFYVKVPTEDVKKVRASLTFISAYQGIPCHFKITQVCPILIQALQ